ncbi:MAG: endonuclease III [Candidatus Aegiribacteria sp.]|nr:endonuclease III [Candidatus Aegiribacteria sp.]
MRRTKRVAILLEMLPVMYPNARCLLDYEGKPERLLIATILSARTTDPAVNKVTPHLWKKVRNIEGLSASCKELIEEIVHPLGFFRSKARSIQEAAAWLTAHEDVVPGTIDELITIPGVGRKTANVIIGEVFHKPAIIVDTHFSRLSLRLDLTRNTQPSKIEVDLKRLLPKDSWTSFSHQLGFHGREVCLSRKPKCSNCEFDEFCPKKGV